MNHRLAPSSDVLLIEDDADIGRNLHAGLEAHGYRARWCRTGTNGLSVAAARAPRVVLLDLGLPDTDGVEVARTLRQAHPDLLLIILTARAADIDVVVGLDAGADDYLTKPVTLTVLLARLRAHLRSRATQADDREPIRLGDLTVDMAARRSTVAGTEISLRPKEFDLLAVLARQPGVAIRREEIMAEVWDENWFGSTKTLDVTMADLRQRLTEAAGGAHHAVVPTISTLRGYGYRLEQTDRTTPQP